MREIPGTTTRVIRALVVQPLQRIRVASPWMLVEPLPRSYWRSLVEPLPSEVGIYPLSS
jgi:hypothetical protein